jgi:hypothetical protein
MPSHNLHQPHLQYFYFHLKAVILLAPSHLLSIYDLNDLDDKRMQRLGLKSLMS